MCEVPLFMFGLIWGFGVRVAGVRLGCKDSRFEVQVQGSGFRVEL